MNIVVDITIALLLGMVCTSIMIGLWYLLRPVLIRLRCPVLTHSLLKITAMLNGFSLLFLIGLFFHQNLLYENVKLLLVTPFIIWGSRALVLIWISGCIFCASRMLLSWRRFQKQLQPALPAEEPFQECFQRVCRDLKTRPGRVHVYRVYGIPSGMTVGILKPKILLPEGEMKDEAMYLTILHEMIHQRQGDMWVNLGILLSQVLQWYNPLLRRFHKDAREWNEFICDYRVCEVTDDSRTYFAFLLGILFRESGLIPQDNQFQHSASEGFLQMKRRMDMCKKLREREHRGKLGSALVMAVCLCLITATLSVSVQAAAWGYERLYDLTEEEVEGMPVSHTVIEESYNDINDYPDNSNIDPLEYANTGVIFRDVLPLEGAFIEESNIGATARAIARSYDWYIDPEDLKAGSSFRATSAENLNIAGAVAPNTSVFRMGYIAPNGVRYCTYVTKTFSVTFELQFNGTYCIYAINDMSSQIHVTGTYSTYTRPTE